MRGQATVVDRSLPVSPGEAAALWKFVDMWTEREQVLGIMLTGSCSIGLADEFSDIDLYVTLSDESLERERGDHLIDGYIVEYNADPLRYIRTLQEEQHRAGLRHCARKIATGIILFDRDESLHDLQREAEIRMRTPFARTDHIGTEMAKYYMWDQLEDLRRLHAHQSPGFPYAYFCGIQNIIGHYARFLGVEVLRPVRMYQFITDPEFRLKYRVEGIADDEFICLTRSCMETVDMEMIERLTHYAQEKMGGFALDGWKLRVAVPPSPLL